MSFDGGNVADAELHKEILALQATKEKKLKVAIAAHGTILQLKTQALQAMTAFYDKKLKELRTEIEGLQSDEMTSANKETLMGNEGMVASEPASMSGVQGRGRGRGGGGRGKRAAGAASSMEDASNSQKKSRGKSYDKKDALGVELSTSQPENADAHVSEAASSNASILLTDSIENITGSTMLLAWCKNNGFGQEKHLKAFCKKEKFVKDSDNDHTSEALKELENAIAKKHEDSNFQIMVAQMAYQPLLTLEFASAGHFIREWIRNVENANINSSTLSFTVPVRKGS